MNFEHLILQVSAILLNEFFLFCAASADRITLRTRFQAWLSSFSPSVTRWSDPVYMQTYSLTPPFTAIQSILLTPYCESHQSDQASPSLPSQSWSSLCQPPELAINLLLNDWLMLLDQSEGKVSNWKIKNFRLLTSIYTLYNQHVVYSYSTYYNSLILHTHLYEMNKSREGFAFSC